MEPLDSLLRDRGPKGDDSLDVLVQITLPIVLILAYVVFTEIRSLRDERDQARKDQQAIVTQQARAEAEIAFLTLQRQLLARSVQAVVEAFRKEIAFDDYDRVTAAPDQILDKSVDKHFVEISSAIYDRFDGTEKLIATTGDLQRRVLVAFESSVQELKKTYPSLTGSSRLLAITPENRRLMEADLSGQLESIQGKAVTVQLQCILDWIKNQRATEIVANDSSAAFAEAIRGDESARRRFQNVKVLDLRRRLGDMGAPLLGRTLAGVL